MTDRYPLEPVPLSLLLKDQNFILIFSTNSTVTYRQYKVTPHFSLSPLTPHNFLAVLGFGS